MYSFSSTDTGFAFDSGYLEPHLTPYGKTPPPPEAAGGALNTPTPLIFRRTPEDVNRFEAWRNAIRAVSATPPSVQMAARTPVQDTPGSAADSDASSIHFARWLEAINSTPGDPMCTTPAASTLGAQTPLTPMSTGATPAARAGAMRLPLHQMQAPKSTSRFKPGSSAPAAEPSSALKQRQHLGASSNAAAAGGTENMDPTQLLLTPMSCLSLKGTDSTTAAGGGQRAGGQASLTQQTPVQQYTPGWRSRMAVGGLCPAPASPMQQAIDLMLQSAEELLPEGSGGGAAASPHRSPIALTPAGAKQQAATGPAGRSQGVSVAATPAAQMACSPKVQLTPEQKVIDLMLHPGRGSQDSSSPPGAVQQGGQGKGAISAMEDDLEDDTGAADDVDSLAAEGDVSDDEIELGELLEVCGVSSLERSGVAEVMEFVLCTPGAGRAAAASASSTPVLGSTSCGGMTEMLSSAAAEGLGEEVVEEDVAPRVLFADDD